MAKRQTGVPSGRSDSPAQAQEKASFDGVAGQVAVADTARREDGAVALRQARQKAYRTRQGEAAALLQRLWRLRQLREQGISVGVALTPSWDDLVVMCRRLVHEEELVHLVAAEARAVAAAAGGGRGRADAGLSTLHSARPGKKRASTSGRKSS